MNENFEMTEVETLFENQIHERYEFSVKIQGDEYRGILHEGKIKWYQPQPDLEKELLEAVETNVQNILIAPDGQNVDNIQVKPLFEGQVHERYQFTLKFQGNEFQGVYHDGDIHWFNPQPKQVFGAVQNKLHKTTTDPDLN